MNFLSENNTFDNDIMMLYEHLNNFDEKHKDNEHMLLMLVKLIYKCQDDKECVFYVCWTLMMFHKEIISMLKGSKRVSMEKFVKLIEGIINESSCDGELKERIVNVYAKAMNVVYSSQRCEIVNEVNFGVNNIYEEDVNSDNSYNEEEEDEDNVVVVGNNCFKGFNDESWGWSNSNSNNIRKCQGCCVGKISQKEYNQYIDEVIALLKGGGREVINHYKTLMQEAAQRMDFEQAQMYKEKMQSIEQHYSKSVIINSTVGDVDVFSLVSDGPEYFGNFMRIRGGAIVQSLNLGFKLMIEEEQESVLAMFVGEIQSKFGELSKEVIVPFLPDMSIDGVDFRIPVRGDKLALLELSARNAKEMRLNALKQQEHTDPDAYRNMVMESLQKQLGMSELPVHIECFDNSNIQGTNPVSACVVFRNAVPSKKDYRHFKVKTVVGANDYATMKEVVNRRYSRMLEENPEDLPQLIVIDGGKGQLSFAYEALCELGIIDKVTLIALAERMEEVYRLGDPYPLFIDRNSPALKVLQQIRDEAHRFGITFHRKLRSKSQIESALRNIKGVGDKTEQRLLLHFGSVARIAAASVDDIAALVGPALAQTIHDELNKKS